MVFFVFYYYIDDVVVNDDNFKQHLFLGARHTVYYTRVGQEAKLLIDRIEVPLEKLPPQGLWEVYDVGSNEVQIGGLNTTDPRLIIYKGYNGCLSSKRVYYSYKLGLDLILMASS